MTDPVPLPYCPDCGHVHPGYDIQKEGYSAWGFNRPVYACGPVDWRWYPEFRCGCRIVHEAREKGLIDEACGGKTWAGKPESTTAMGIRLESDARMRLEISGNAAEPMYEACGGHGAGEWSMERLVGARIGQAIDELQKVATRGLWYDWGPGGLKSARERMMILDAKVEANRKLYEGRQW